MSRVFIYCPYFADCATALLGDDRSSAVMIYDAGLRYDCSSTPSLTNQSRPIGLPEDLDCSNCALHLRHEADSEDHTIEISTEFAKVHYHTIRNST